ncbi:hypothetical protein [Pseudacidovorax intermedius]|uniref:hypothetical protein n=1 Tax=Pseudacidovorax intermedius TaxID=433924 RepID=UPI00128F560B|nr:hypothetical protein [Pseudacidovorax intermedius]
MSKLLTRRAGLALTAKIYELAAQYSHEELMSFLNDKSLTNSLTVKSVVKNLAALHDEVEQSELGTHQTNLMDVGSDEQARKRSAVYRDDDGWKVVRHSDKGSYTKKNSFYMDESSLKTLLADEKVFPSLSDAIAATGIPGRPKEARSRYVSRVHKEFEDMNYEQKKAFIQRLSKVVRDSSKDSESFIYRWSELIKGM